MSTKTVFKYFTITQYNEEAEYLRAMHRQGWKLVNIRIPGFYTFESCTPEDVIYQLDYNKEGIEHKAEYTRMFADCGWEYMFDFVGYSYFRKPAAQMDGHEEIFCDDDSRRDMLIRVFNGRLKPMCIFFPVIIGYIFFSLSIMNRHSTWIWGPVLFIIYTVIALMYLIIFVTFALDYYRLTRTNRK